VPVAGATSPRLHHLPAEATSFVGRRAEVAQARRLLSSSRLVTLTGPGGVGKTRLALRVARGTARSFPDGVWFVDLAALQGPALLTHTLLHALDIGEQSTRDPIDVLLGYLRGRRLLLVLDNCERLSLECARLAATLLRGAPELRMLVTSRQSLGIGGERIMTVAPLAMPAPDWMGTSRVVPEHHAVALFVQRARAVDPGFALTPENEEAVVRLCRQLDGLPLAIELAAARLQLFPLPELVAGLDEHGLPTMPASGTREVRHHTLDATLRWSFELCDEAERRMWARVSVFSGSFDLAAAESVCADGDIDTLSVLDLLASLIDKSVLIREEDDGEVRYRLLDTVRRFGLERLRTVGEERELRNRHRDWYLYLAGRGEADWFGPRQVAWFTSLRREHANLRAALTHSLATESEAGRAQHMASTLWFYWIACGFVAEGCHWLERALQADIRPTRERARALWVNGYLTGFSGHNPAATAMFEDSRDLARRLGDESSLAYATQLLGLAAASRGEPAEGQALLTDALARHRTQGQFDALVAMGEVMLAFAAVGQGDWDGAVALCQECRATSQARGELWVQSWALWVLALVEWSRGRCPEAAEYARECLRIKQIFHDVLGMAFALDMLVWTAVAEAANERAAVLLGAAQATWLTMGKPLGSAPVLVESRERSEAGVRRALGERAFEEAVQRGMNFDVDEAVDYALGGHPPAR
jgi:predicted ATPase